MSTYRFILRLKNAGGVTDVSAPVAYYNFNDATAAGIAAAPAGGYTIVDGWHMGRLITNTTVIRYDAASDLRINDHTAKNYLGQASELFPL